MTHICFVAARGFSTVRDFDYTVKYFILFPVNNLLHCNLPVRTANFYEIQSGIITAPGYSKVIY